jgi:pimeloyl-ACP methyl ester carboxylesterase
MGTAECNGARLVFDDGGGGDPPLLLVHGGAFCDRRYVAPLFAHFTTRHRVVAPDLRGHGESSREGPIANEQFADDLASLCRELSLDGPVVIGHSSGGHAALELARRHPEVARALVLLDIGPLAWPAERVAGNQRLAAGLRTDAGPTILRAVAESMMPASEPFPDRDALLDRVRLASPEVFAQLIEADLGWDGAGAASACPESTPVLLVVADHPLVEPEELRRHCPHAMVGRTVGSGHFHQLVVPDQVIAMIERFLVLIEEPSS